jgi:hypothetical protein
VATGEERREPGICRIPDQVRDDRQEWISIVLHIHHAR